MALSKRPCTEFEYILAGVITPKSCGVEVPELLEKDEQLDEL